MMEKTVIKQTHWKVDKLHSDVQFKVKHLVISTVTGSFGEFDADVTSEEDGFSGSTIRFTADINSISTGVPDRDKHLRSDDFFNAEKYPQLVFQSSSYNSETNQLKGHLTIRDITLPIALSAYFGGIVSDQYGQIKAGFEVSGTINRKDFGLKWSGVTEAGGVVVADEVKIICNVQFIKQP